MARKTEKADRGGGGVTGGGVVGSLRIRFENFDSVFQRKKGAVGGDGIGGGGRLTPRSNLPQTAPTQLIRS